MSKFTHEGTEELTRLADEVERERAETGHSTVNDVPDPEDDGATREDHADEASPLEGVDGPTQAGAIGAASRIRGPGV